MSEAGSDLVMRLQQLEEQQRAFAEALAHGLDDHLHLARSAWRVQEEERRRLARDLHDGVGQNLTALDHQLSRLEDQGVAAEQCEQARMLCQQTLKDIRDLSRLLHPPMLEDLGLESTLQWLARTIQQSSGLEVDVICSDLPDSLPTEVSILIFRVAQEALNNAVKYAQASAASVLLRNRKGRLVLQVIDNGQGFDPQAAVGTGLGLAGMRERAELLGADIVIESAPGEGSRLRLKIDLAQE